MTYLTSKMGTCGEPPSTFPYLMAWVGVTKTLHCKGFRYLRYLPYLFGKIMFMGKIAGGERGCSPSYYFIS